MGDLSRSLAPAGNPSAEFQTTFRTSGRPPASVGELVSYSATFYGILLPRTSDRSLPRLPGLVLQANVEAPLQASSGASSLFLCTRHRRPNCDPDYWADVRNRLKGLLDWDTPSWTASKVCNRQRRSVEGRYGPAKR